MFSYTEVSPNMGTVEIKYTYKFYQCLHYHVVSTVI